MTSSGRSPAGLQPSEGPVTISQLSAHWDRDRDLIGKQDPYLVFELGLDRETTPVIKSGGTDVNWNQTFTLSPGRGGSLADTLKITASNKNTLLPDQSLGHASITLAAITPGKSTHVTLHKHGKVTGEVTFVATQRSSVVSIGELGSRSNTATAGGANGASGMGSSTGRRSPAPVSGAATTADATAAGFVAGDTLSYRNTGPGTGNHGPLSRSRDGEESTSRPGVVDKIKDTLNMGSGGNRDSGVDNNNASRSSAGDAAAGLPATMPAGEAGVNTLGTGVGPTGYDSMAPAPLLEQAAGYGSTAPINPDVVALNQAGQPTPYATTAPPVPAAPVTVAPVGARPVSSGGFGAKEGAALMAAGTTAGLMGQPVTYSAARPPSGAGMSAGLPATTATDPAGMGTGLGSFTAGGAPDKDRNIDTMSTAATAGSYTPDPVTAFNTAVNAAPASTDSGLLQRAEEGNARMGGLVGERAPADEVAIHDRSMDTTEDTPSYTAAAAATVGGAAETVKNVAYDAAAKAQEGAQVVGEKLREGAANVGVPGYGAPSTEYETTSTMQRYNPRGTQDEPAVTEETTSAGSYTGAAQQTTLAAYNTAADTANVAAQKTRDTAAAAYTTAADTANVAAQKTQETASAAYQTVADTAAVAAQKAQETASVAYQTVADTVAVAAQKASDVGAAAAQTTQQTLQTPPEESQGPGVAAKEVAEEAAAVGREKMEEPAVIVTDTGAPGAGGMTSSVGEYETTNVGATYNPRGYKDDVALPDQETAAVQAEEGDLATGPEEGALVLGAPATGVVDRESVSDIGTSTATGEAPASTGILGAAQNVAAAAVDKAQDAAASFGVGPKAAPQDTTPATPSSYEAQVGETGSTTQGNTTTTGTSPGIMGRVAGVLAGTAAVAAETAAVAAEKAAAAVRGTGRQTQAGNYGAPIPDQSTADTAIDTPSSTAVRGVNNQAPQTGVIGETPVSDQTAPAGDYAAAPDVNTNRNIAGTAAGFGGAVNPDQSTTGTSIATPSGTAVRNTDTQAANTDEAPRSDFASALNPIADNSVNNTTPTTEGLVETFKEKAAEAAAAMGVGAAAKMNKEIEEDPSYMAETKESPYGSTTTPTTTPTSNSTTPRTGGGIFGALRQAVAGVAGTVWNGVGERPTEDTSSAQSGSMGFPADTAADDDIGRGIGHTTGITEPARDELSSGLAEGGGLEGSAKAGHGDQLPTPTLGAAVLGGGSPLTASGNLPYYPLQESPSNAASETIPTTADEPIRGPTITGTGLTGGSTLNDGASYGPIGTATGTAISGDKAPRTMGDTAVFAGETQPLLEGQSGADKPGFGSGSAAVGGATAGGSSLYDSSSFTPVGTATGTPLTGDKTPATLGATGTFAGETASDLPAGNQPGFGSGTGATAGAAVGGSPMYNEASYGAVGAATGTAISGDKAPRTMGDTAIFAGETRDQVGGNPAPGFGGSTTTGSAVGPVIGGMYSDASFTPVGTATGTPLTGDRTPDTLTETGTFAGEPASETQAGGDSTTAGFGGGGATAYLADYKKAGGMTQGELAAESGGQTGTQQGGSGIFNRMKQAVWGAKEGATEAYTPPEGASPEEDPRTLTQKLADTARGTVAGAQQGMQGSTGTSAGGDDVVGMSPGGHTYSAHSPRSRQ